MNKKMFVWMTLLMVTLPLLISCGSDKNTTEACQYETTMNLDKGNYDAVLTSSCANSMQKGAAYFGKAGYDIKDVINKFSEAKTATNDLTIYMNALTAKVNENDLANIDKAKTEYDNIQAASDYYKDAQFYLGLINAVKAMSLLKLITDSAGIGTLSTACDKNMNQVPDSVDATSCALLVSAGQNCTTLNGSGAVNITTDAQNITITNKTGIYRGLVIAISGNGTSTACPNANNEHKKLLFWQGAPVAMWAPATTSAELCQESSPANARTWPCPIIQNDQPLDLVTAVDQSITSAISSMNTSLEGTITTDIQTSITDIKTQACGTDGTCSSSDIASYLQTIK